MNVRFLTLAQQEVDDAFNWFDERTEGSGLEFLDDLDRLFALSENIQLRFLKSNLMFVAAYFLAFLTIWFTESMKSRLLSLLYRTLIANRFIGSTV